MNHPADAQANFSYNVWTGLCLEARVKKRDKETLAIPECIKPVYTLLITVTTCFIIFLQTFSGITFANVILLEHHFPIPYFKSCAFTHDS